MFPSCPTCRSSIAQDDVNVAQDLALCRACSHVYALSSLAKRSDPAQLDRVDLRSAPRGVRLIQNATEVALVISTRSLPAALFFIPFTALWSGGSLTGIYGSQFRSGHFSLGQSLFGLPFLLGSMILIPITFMLICGHVKIRLRGEEGQIYAGVSFIGLRKKFRASEITDVYIEHSKPDSDNDRTWSIVLDRKPKPLKLSASSNPEQRNFVAAVLRAWLGMAGRTTPPIAAPLDDSSRAA